MSLDVSKLANVHAVNGRTEAACPACREGGNDTAGNHLRLYPDGRFGCVAFPGPAGAEHRKRIFELAGQPDKREPAQPKRKARPARTWPDVETAARACTPEGFALAAVYRYPKAGADFAAVARYENGAGKTFKQFSKNGAGWIAGGPSGLWPLHGLDTLTEGVRVYVVEGEKTKAAAASIRLPCVTSAGGSAAAGKTDWQPLAGRTVAILPDADEPGAKYAADVAEILAHLDPPARVRVIELPNLADLGEGADVADWLDARDAAEPETLRAEIEALADAAPEQGALPALDGAALLRDAPPPHEPILAGLFDRRALVEIVGPSKTRKSFAVIQLALNLVAGRGAFGFETGGRFSVCVADMELSEADLRRRVWRMGRALGIGPEDVEGRLRILTLAGIENPRQIIERAAVGFDIVIADPLYALCDGAENIENFREPLRWLRRLAVGRAACLFVHHDAKGTPGDRETRDRGSGSGITGRSVDARMTLTPAAADPENAVCMAFMCRSYVTPEPRAFVFEDDAFQPSDLPAEPERMTDRRARAARPKLAGFYAAAVRVLEESGPMSPAVFKQRLREELSMSKGDADTLTAALCEPDGPARRWREGGFDTQWKIGTKDQAPTSRYLPGRRREVREEGPPYLQPPAL